MKILLANIRITIGYIFLSLLCIGPLWGDDRNDGEDEAIMFANQELLDPVFERLFQLEQSRAWKINIVHVGDSHIQADFLTDVIRKSLQSQFGDGGYGFTFPYSLMRTNGADCIRYNSNANWKSRLNVSPVSPAVDVGLSGIGLYTDDSNFTIQLSANKEWTFNSIKVLYSTKDPQYQISLTDNPVTTVVEEEITEGNQVIHRIKRGENLSVIAARYGTTVNVLKTANNLVSDNIQAGRTLNIPSSANATLTTRKVRRKSVDYVKLQSYPYYSSYMSSDPLNRISFFSRDNQGVRDINGFVLENDKPGLIYHGIGVNGAKMSDFSKYPLFFKQLNVLQPDLVVLSFGTNESFQKLSAEQYVQKLQEMVTKIKEENPNAVVIAITPPPSLRRRRESNSLIGEYSAAMMALSNIPVWDLFSRMEGEAGIVGRGKYADIIARDKIHYTIGGYKIQGEMFSGDFIKAYKQFLKRRKG